jgi:Holliday junction resolvase RusA-like endonuclease
MQSIRFEVPGTPQGKARPRFRRCGGFVRTYTPARTQEYEEKIRNSYRKESGYLFEKGQPISVSVSATFPIPKSLSKKKRAALIGKYHTKKCDTDNLLKSVLDALNGVAYSDDSQISVLTGVKRYGADPRIVVQIEGAENE